MKMLFDNSIIFLTQPKGENNYLILHFSQCFPVVFFSLRESNPKSKLADQKKKKQNSKHNIGVFNTWEVPKSVRDADIWTSIWSRPMPAAPVNALWEF